MIIRVNKKGNRMLLKKAAEWIERAEEQCCENHEKSNVSITAAWCSSVNGYIMWVKIGDSPSVVISSQRTEKRVFKKTDSMIKALNDVGLSKVTIIRS